MGIVALKLVGLLLLLLPILSASWACWRRCWRTAPSSECLLAALICVPGIVLLEVVGLGSIPFGRPLRLLIWLQLATTGLGVYLTWRCRADFRRTLRQMGEGLAEGWRTSLWSQRVALILGLVIHLSATAYGAWNTPSSWDELSYHVPQAVQPYQDGRLGRVQANVIWADSYPRGVELLYYWTLQLAHTDAGFHPVNASFGFIFILATYVAAMRLGLGRGWAWLAAGIVPTAPIFWHLATIGYIDLSVAGALAVVLTMALPEREARESSHNNAKAALSENDGDKKQLSTRWSWSWGSCIAMLSAATLTLLMKFPPFALIAIAIGYRGALIAWQGLRAMWQNDRPRPRPGTALYFGVVLLATGLASIPYLRTWHRYGSPVYPLGLRIGSVTVFSGPMDTAALTQTSKLPLLERFSTAWSGWYAPVHADSPGSFGPLFSLAVVTSALVCLLSELRSRNAGWLLVVAAFWMVMVLPEHHLNRYALYVLLPGALCTARLGQMLSQAAMGRTWALGILALAMVNAHVIRWNAKYTVRYQQSFGIPLLTEARNQPIERQTIQTPFAPTPETHRQVQEHMRPGETLICAVADLQGLLHDYRYSYRVEHRPALAWPYGYIPPYDLTRGVAEAPAWLEGLLRDGVQGAIVYKDSAEDKVLRPPGSGYECVYDQAPLLNECGIRFYRKRVQ